MTDRGPLPNLHRDALVRVDGCHGGVGHVGVYRPFSRGDDTAPRVDFIDLAVVPPGSEIGRHRHGDDEECYVILRGSAEMYLDGRTFRVGPGDIVANQPFGEHGLVNDTDEDVHLFVFQTSR
jgi:mannose-6-phosphate isomerase-like protein (cupin superfamily)